ncbi:hypothetical protein NKH77_39400 [Streptomyces sp. M19]
MLFAGGLFLIAGSVVFAFLSNHYGPDIKSWQMGIPLFVMGLGMGYVIAPVIDFALTDVPHEASGSASGTFNTTQQLGNSIGIALLGVIFLAALPGQSGHGVDSVEAKVRTQLSAVQVSERSQDDILANYRTCVKDRAHETDPSAVPASCQVPPPGVTQEQGAKVGQILAANSPTPRP